MDGERRGLGGVELAIELGLDQQYLVAFGPVVHSPPLAVTARASDCLARHSRDMTVPIGTPVSSPDCKLKGQALPLRQDSTRRKRWAIRRTGSRSIAIVTVRVIAVPIIARVKAGVPTVETVAAAEPKTVTEATKTATEAAKTATESKTVTEATKTATSKTTTVEASAKATGLNGISSSRRGKHDSHHSKSQWQSADHVSAPIRLVAPVVLRIRVYVYDSVMHTGILFPTK